MLEPFSLLVLLELQAWIIELGITKSAWLAFLGLKAPPSASGPLLPRKLASTCPGLEFLRFLDESARVCSVTLLLPFDWNVGF